MYQAFLHAFGEEHSDKPVQTPRRSRNNSLTNPKQQSFARPRLCDLTQVFKMKLSVLTLLMTAAVPATAEPSFLRSQRALQTCDATSTCAYEIGDTCGSATSCKTLYAGQTIDVGTVCTTYEGDALTVTYTTTGEWYIDQTHLWVGPGIDGSMPQNNKGNPKIGLFPYGVEYGTTCGEQTWSYTIDAFTANFLVTDALPTCAACADAGAQFTVDVAAHAAVYKCVGGEVVQTETGWSDGENMVERGSWATQSDFCLNCACEGDQGDNDDEGSCETSFAYGGTCFLDVDADGDGEGDFNRWGWYVPVSEGTQTFDVYAAAGQCDINKGTLVGTLTVVLEGGTATMTQTAAEGFTFSEMQFYAGSEILPRDGNGLFTVAPGQYPSVVEFGETSVTTYTDVQSPPGGVSYVVVHGVACGDFTA